MEEARQKKRPLVFRLAIPAPICYTVLAGKEARFMNMMEASRVILGLRAAGWDEKSINDFILWIETGDEKYKPVEKDKQ